MSQRSEPAAAPGFLGLDRRGWPGTIAVAAVVAVIALGLPLLNRLVSADQPVEPGTAIDVGRGVAFTAVDGWSIDAEQTDAQRDIVVLHKGPLALLFEARASDRSLPEEYDRLAEEIRSGAGVQLFNGATAFTTDGGLTGMGGSYSSPESEGRFAVLQAGDTVVRLLAKGPPDAMAADLGDVEQMVQTLRIGPP
ncbi:MAG TPA: hypothetical protein VID93_04325 [Acidimicrobiales bacterium]